MAGSVGVPVTPRAWHSSPALAGPQVPKACGRPHLTLSLSFAPESRSAVFEKHYFAVHSNFSKEYENDTENFYIPLPHFSQFATFVWLFFFCMHITICCSESFGSRTRSREGGLEGGIGTFSTWAREGCWFFPFLCFPPALLVPELSCSAFRTGFESFLSLAVGSWLHFQLLVLLEQCGSQARCGCWEQMRVLLTSTRLSLYSGRQSPHWHGRLAWGTQHTACWHEHRLFSWTVDPNLGTHKQLITRHS